MLDIKRIRAEAEDIKQALAKRHGDFPIDKVLELDEDRRNLLMEVEQMKAKRNSDSKRIPELKKEGKDVEAIFQEMKDLSEQVKEKDLLVKDIDEKLKALLLEIPNTPH